MVKTVGNIRHRKSTSEVTDIVWEIDDALTLLEKDFVLQSCTFSFRSLEWRLEMQCVETSWGRKLFHVLSMKGLAPDSDKAAIKWKAGILRSDESEYETDNGEICLNKNCPMWIQVKTWVSRCYKFLLSERELLVPEGRLSIFLRLSVDPKQKLTQPREIASVSIQTDFEDRSRDSVGKKADEIGSRVTKTEGIIRIRESTYLVTDIVWDIDDALTLLRKDCILRSSTFSFRSHEWKLELQCVETSFGLRTFHALSRKGSVRDNSKGIINWKAGILSTDRSEYNTANGETSLNKYCPMWDIASVWVGHDCKFLKSDSKWLLPEGRLSVYLRLSVDPSLELKEPRDSCLSRLAHVSLVTDFEDRSGDPTGKITDERDYSIVSEMNTGEANFGNCPHNDDLHRMRSSGGNTIAAVPHEAGETVNSAHENEGPSLVNEGFAYISLPTDFENRISMCATGRSIPGNVDELDAVDSGNSDPENERSSRGKKGSKKVLEDITDLWLTGDQSDLIVEVRGVRFSVHRAILTKRIPKLASEFQSFSSEITEVVLMVQDCDPEAFREFLHYVYTGSPLCMTPTNAFSIYQLADKYRVDDLKEKCLECMKDTLCLDSFVDTALLALKYSELELLQRVTSFFTDNIRCILRRMDWQIFMEDHSTWANELLIKSQGLP